jgi:hypothetical protein
MGKFLGFILLLLITIPVSLLRGVVASDVIAWFTPFHVTVVQAIGLSILVGLFTSGLAHKEDKTKNGEWYTPAFESLINSVFFSLFAWGTAWAWHLWL